MKVTQVFQSVFAVAFYLIIMSFLSIGVSQASWENKWEFNWGDKHEQLVKNFTKDFARQKYFNRPDLKARSSQTEYAQQKQGSNLSDSKKLKCEMGYRMIPHPQKAHKGGEDAMFITKDLNHFGIADGVGGWSVAGVDPSLYPKKLVQLIGEYMEGKESSKELPYEALEYAFYEMLNYKIKGSTTACVLSLNKQQNKLFTTNFGDSGFLIIRKGEVVLSSPVMQSGFNMPYQLGYPPEYSTNVKYAKSQEFDVQAGDIVVVATDGLLDNLYEEQIKDVISIAIKDNQNAQEAANLLAMVAQQLSFDRFYQSPFAQTCQQAQKTYMGGKPDDISVIVSYIQYDDGTPVDYSDFKVDSVENDEDEELEDSENSNESSQTSVKMNQKQNQASKDDEATSKL